MTEVRLDTSGDELLMLREVVVRAHQLATGNYVQTPIERLSRLAALLTAAVHASDAIRGFLGYGGPEAHRDILSGTGELA